MAEQYPEVNYGIMVIRVLVIRNVVLRLSNTVYLITAECKPRGKGYKDA